MKTRPDAPRTRPGKCRSLGHARPLPVIPRPLLLLLGALFFLSAHFLTPSAPAAEDAMRFPAPEFEGNYAFPDTSVPAPPLLWREWTDVGVLVAALSLAAWLAIKRRSRRGLFWLTLFSLAYFGFFRQGCVCPIGATQNVTLSLSETHYAIPLTVLLFFLIPLIFAMFFGRVFCSSVCPLGAIQDLVILKPIRLSRKWTVALSMLPYLYLGLAVLLAAAGAGFIICRFDPFVGFFRLNGHAPYLYVGAALLLIGLVIARPYCRFLCPYGVLLGWLSRISKWHLSITPSQCVDCRLCETSCPFDYIKKPNTGLARENRATGVRRLSFLFLMLPALLLLGGWVGYRLAIPLSGYHHTVRLAEQVLAEQQDPSLEPTLQTTTFRSMGTTEQELLSRARSIRARLKTGGWMLGGVLGLVFGLKLIGFSLFRNQKDYEVDRTHCFSCGRCCAYCPSDDIHRPNFQPGSRPLREALALAETGAQRPSATAGKGGA